MTEQQRQHASEFLKKIDEVFVGENCFSWRWQPFREPSVEESRAIDMRSHLRSLRAVYMDREHRDQSLDLAAAILQDPGGYSLKEGWLEARDHRFHLSNKRYRQELNNEQVTLEQFERDFERFAMWDETGAEPDWEWLRRRIIVVMRKTHAEIEGWTLARIWQALPQVAMERGNSDDPVSSESIYRWRFDGTDWRIAYGDPAKEYVLTGSRVGCYYYARLLMNPHPTKPVNPSALFVAMHPHEERLKRKNRKPEEIISRENLKEVDKEIGAAAAELAQGQREGWSTDRIAELKESLQRWQDWRGKLVDRHGKPRKTEKTVAELNRASVLTQLERTREVLVKKGAVLLVNHLISAVCLEKGRWGYFPEPKIVWDVTLPVGEDKMPTKKIS